MKPLVRLVLALTVLLSHTAHARQDSARFSIRDLGTLGGTFSDALAINDRGQIMGRSSLSGDSEFRPFLWDRRLQRSP